MTSVCLYFQVHQPVRIKNYTFFDIGESHEYFNDSLNEEVLNKVSDSCYLKTNAILLELIEKLEGRFRFAFSFSGVLLEQLELHRPDVIASFRKLTDTGCVEILSETYYHSLAFAFSKTEFDRQVQLHKNKIEQLFGKTPVVFRNTELIYSNDLANHLLKLGYKGVLAEGSDTILKGKSQNYLFRSAGTGNLKILTRNYNLSDDIAFRFSDKNWSEYPLSATRFANKIHRHAEEADVINLFMDYETFGEHQWEETGIFSFLKLMPEKILRHLDFEFNTPAEAIALYQPRDIFDCPIYSSWADTERDISAWLGNSMQMDAAKKLYEWEKQVLEINDPKLTRLWSLLQSSDHFYYMSTKGWNDGAVHNYFSPFNSPYDAYLHFMNILSDMEIKYFSSKK